MKKAYLTICIPPAAALLALLLIRLIFWQSEASLRPTLEEIDKAPFKPSPAVKPNRGGGAGIRLDLEKLRKVAEGTEDKGNGETTGEGSGATSTISPKSSSTPETTAQKGPFREDLAKERKDNDTARVSHNDKVRIGSDIAALLVALAGYGTIGYMFWKQYKKPVGWEEALATARREAAAQRGSSGQADTQGTASGGTGEATAMGGTDSDLVFLDEDDVDDDYEVEGTADQEPHEEK
jgi:hypothetical protein